MIFKIKKTIEVEENIEIELPFYYEHFMDYSVIYGRVEENKCTTITLSHSREEYEITIEKRPASHYGCYMSDKSHHSSEEEFLEALSRVKEAISTIWT